MKLCALQELPVSPLKSVMQVAGMLFLFVFQEVESKFPQFAVPDLIQMWRSGIKTF